MKFATRAIHVGQEADPTTGATIVPIYQTSTYTQEAIGQHKGYEYSRTGNPTRTALEQCLASLEEARFGLCFSSGMGATTTVLMCLKAGDHVVASDDVYGGTYRLFQKVLTEFGLSFTFVDARDLASVKAAMTDRTKLVWLETPTNPLLRLADIPAIAAITRQHGASLCVDNTFASPYLQTPLDLGADLVVHSTTKYIGGHSDVVGGAIMTNDETWHTALKFRQNSMGATPGPFDCWLTLRGVKTLALRMKQHEINANAVAQFLRSHPLVTVVHYPGLAEHPQHELAKRQMRGFGGMISFEVVGGLDGGKQVVTRTELVALAEGLGGAESLIGHPATMTHLAIPADERRARGVTDGLIRLSVGIEDTEDLIEDLRQALAVLG
ncbi:MAG: cystathionine gamma-synthase [Candidatus Sericytochromatia bacterium]|nr:cystathionine gamma-synthase [Candidatus Sericytochromatia bacterium]